MSCANEVFHVPGLPRKIALIKFPFWRILVRTAFSPMRWLCPEKLEKFWGRYFCARGWGFDWGLEKSDIVKREKQTKSDFCFCLNVCIKGNIAIVIFWWELLVFDFVIFSMNKKKSVCFLRNVYRLFWLNFLFFGSVIEGNNFPKNWIICWSSCSEWKWFPNIIVIVAIFQNKNRIQIVCIYDWSDILSTK